MQKVVGSSPIIRSSRRPRKRGLFRVRTWIRGSSGRAIGKLIGKYSADGVSLGAQYDDQVIELLALGNQLTTTRIARELKVDDGALTMRLFALAKEDLIRVCGADGSTPVWEITDAGRARRARLRGR
jgi:hypothetical protein